MNQHAIACSCRSISPIRLKFRSALLLVIFFTLTGLAQQAASQSFEIDCYATVQSYATTNPGLRCTCASRTSSPNCSSGSTGSSHSVPPAMTTNQMVQQEVAGAVVNAFINMLFSDNSRANAQKQKMMEELKARQAAAALQHQKEEAIKLAAICQRLQGTLKLSGTPGLTLKANAAAGTGGLQLKHADQNNEHIGQPGLPGIALNDNTGNGGTAPYGIAGLPGIYTNGPSTPPTPPSGSSEPANGGLRLKMSDDAAVAQTPPAASPTDAAQIAVPDPMTMTPKELADLAANLSPAQQEQLAKALQSTSEGSAGAGSTSSATVEHVSPTTTVGAATAASTTEALLGSPAAPGSSGQPTVASGQSPGGDSAALGQLKGTAAASLKAVQSNMPEGMASGAREGFDTAAGVVISPAQSGGSGLRQIVQSSTQGSSGITGSTPNAAAGAIHPATEASSSFPVVDVAVLKPPPPVTNAKADIRSSSNRPASCLPPTQHRMPTRDEMLVELAQRRTELSNLQRSILRLNRTIQMDQDQLKDWQAEAEAGYERTTNRLLSLPTKLATDTFMEINEDRFKRAEAMKVLTKKGYIQWEMLKRAQEIRKFDDLQKWVLEAKKDETLESFGEGFRNFISAVPLSSEVESYANCVEDLIDTAYDYVDLVSTWQNVQQLDHNSNQFLVAVQGNGEQMKSLVNRIRQIETQLNGVPQGVQLPQCPQ